MIHNDTDSNLLTLFDSDLAVLQFNQTLHNNALQGIQLITTAAGQVYQSVISIEMQIVTSSLEELTPWFEEIAVIQQDGPDAIRLSGARMRDHLYFATAPGNHHLYVAQKKAGLMRLLPA